MTTTVVHQAQPHTVIMPAAQTVQYHHSTGPLPAENLDSSKAKVSGWIQVGCAVSSVILGIVAIAIKACKSYSATPIWCGFLFYLPAGILGVVAGMRKSSCPIIGCMVMSILSAVFSVSHFGVTLSGALHQDDPYYYCSEYYWYGYDYNSDDNAGRITVNGILTIIAVVEFVVSIYASSVMCGGTNCCRARPNTTVTVVSGPAIPTTTTTQVIQTGYPAAATTGYNQPPPMQYGQPPAYPYQPPPGNYPPQSNYPPPGNYPASGNYPPAGYAPSEGKM